MTLVIPANHAHVIHSMTWTGDPEPMAITYGVKLDDANLPTDANALATILRDCFNSTIRAQLQNVLTVTQTEVKWQVAEGPYAPAIGVNTVSMTGGEAGTVLPQNNAFLVHKRSAAGGRGGRGRMYFPGCAEASVSDTGVVSVGETGEWQAALTNWLALIASDNHLVGMCILHDSEGAYAADVPHIVTALQLDPRISTQRRRLRR